MASVNRALQLYNDKTGQENAINRALNGNNDAFKLCLSLYDSGPIPNFNWQSDSSPGNDHFPQRLNHYKRSPTSCSDADLQTYLDWQQSIHPNYNSTAIRFWQSFHPDPLNFTDNPKQLPSDVKLNCAYAAQMRLRNNELAAMAVDVKEQPHQLDEVIVASQALLQ